ncbi:unnamed protein product [Rotaria socialis]|uniref:Uncharacterized protein n=1 Tax=Rotaria socialis TaxID=392032 RepID=A0A818LZK9_9BILA|nr:unnamed protein product [Rotaria socialis]
MYLDRQQRILSIVSRTTLQLQQQHVQPNNNNKRRMLDMSSFSHQSSAKSEHTKNYSTNIVCSIKASFLRFDSERSDANNSCNKTFFRRCRTSSICSVLSSTTCCSINSIFGERIKNSFCHSNITTNLHLLTVSRYSIHLYDGTMLYYWSGNNSCLISLYYHKKNLVNEQKDQHIHLLFDAIYKQLTEKNNLTADILLYTGDSTIRRTNSIQLLRIGKKVVVGVTDGIMIENKVLAKASEPVINFMSNFWSSFDSIRPNINAYRESIGNVCSSSTIMADLNCIILADERQQDAFQVDKQRQENGLSQFAVHIVPMISADKDNQDQDKKLSLISFRQQVLNILLKSRLQSVESNLPCIINGVSIEGSINARRIENLGAGISKCDKLGDYFIILIIENFLIEKINEKFGKDIINSIDREIDRKFVDKKVFQSSDELKILTDIFWNLVLHLMQRIVEYLFKEAQRTIVLDAILLLEATKIIVPMKHGYCIYDYQKSYSMYCRIL